MSTLQPLPSEASANHPLINDAYKRENADKFLSAIHFSWFTELLKCLRVQTYKFVYTCVRSRKYTNDRWLGRIAEAQRANGWTRAFRWVEQGYLWHKFLITFMSNRQNMLRRIIVSWRMLVHCITHVYILLYVHGYSFIHVFLNKFWVQRTS
jgi:hypothetical protein